MMTDPISDMLTRLRNASATGKPEIVFPYSKLKLTVAKILEQEGYVGIVQRVNAKPGAFEEVKIVLKYRPDRESVIHAIKRISTPGRRMYMGYREMKNPSGRGVVIISTPQGLMTSKEARQRKLGGEIICEIY